MSDTLSWSLRTVREHTLLLVADLRDDQAHRQSGPGEHHPAWIVGHLLLGDVYLLYLLGVAPLPDDFAALLAAHGPDSVPATVPAPGLPGFADLVERLRNCGERRADAVDRMSPADLARPLPDPVLARTQPTLGHHLQAAVFHEGHHGGQLAAWRRRQGLDAARWVFAAETPETGGPRGEPGES